MSKQTIKINVPVLTRVEGEGALDLTIKNQQITELKLRIFEPPRYFEKFLQGRNYYDVPDTVARICGICPVAYQMSAAHAIESVFKVKTTPWIRAMRRLFYCGEWLQSHSLHIHLLAAPDFLGFNSVLEMSEQYADEVRRGLKLQALGNDLVALFGARSVHPVGVKIGGFYKAPEQRAVDNLLQRIKDAKQDAIELIKWLDTLDLADDEQDFISVALHHESEYPFNEGRLISDHGLDIAISDFDKHFKEQHVDHSTALHCLLDNKPYLVGPLARVNLNYAQFPHDVKALMSQLKTSFPSKNMFHSIIARGLEIYFCILEAESLLENYQFTNQPAVEFTTTEGTGFGCTEAPRGFLWHRFDMDKNGCVTRAVIVPPTSQNQPRIEEDLRNSLIRFGLDQEKQKLQLHAEKVIRNYDPCISCATHFLNVNLTRDHQKVDTDNICTIPKFNNLHLAKTAIIGIGSPQPNDNTGWLAIEKLSTHPEIITLKKHGLHLLKLDRPGIQLKQILINYAHVIIIDAVVPQQTDNNMSWFTLNELSPDSTIFTSHQLGVAESLQYINQFETLPDDIAILAIANMDETLLYQNILQCLNI